MATITIKGLTDVQARAIVRFFEAGYLNLALEDFRIDGTVYLPLQNLEAHPKTIVDTGIGRDETHERSHIVEYLSDRPF